MYKNLKENLHTAWKLRITWSDSSYNPSPIKMSLAVEHTASWKDKKELWPSINQITTPDRLRAIFSCQEKYLTKEGFLYLTRQIGRQWNLPRWSYSLRSFNQVETLQICPRLWKNVEEGKRWQVFYMEFAFNCRTL